MIIPLRYHVINNPCAAVKMVLYVSILQQIKQIHENNKILLQKIISYTDRLDIWILNCISDSENNNFWTDSGYIGGHD